VISTLRHPFFKPVIFTLLVGVVSGCSAQRSSLIPGGEALVAQTGFPRGRNAQARIVSQTVRAGGKTYVVDEMFTPIETTLQGIASASDSNVWFTGNGIVGKSSITGEMTDYDLSPYQNVTAITEGPDHNLWTTLSPPGVGRITTAGTFDAFAIPKHFAGKNTTLYSIASGFGDLWALDQDYYRYYLLQITPKGQIRGFKLSDNSIPN
jgi:streptogramin lyase